MTHSYATGNVTATDGEYSSSCFVGGFVGMSRIVYSERDRAVVTNCFATGNVTSSGYAVGGLIGTSSSCLVFNSYATGNVSGGLDRVGGLVGINGNGMGDKESVIINSYATGNVAGCTLVGGLRGAGGIVEHSVALNAAISADNPDPATNWIYYLSRVGYSDVDGVNNYAREDMTVILLGDNTYIPDYGHNKRDGEDITSVQWNNADWWRDTVGFDPDVWGLVDGKLPTLRDMPGNPVQDPVVR